MNAIRQRSSDAEKPGGHTDTAAEAALTTAVVSEWLPMNARKMEPRVRNKIEPSVRDCVRPYRPEDC